MALLTTVGIQLKWTHTFPILWRSAVINTMPMVLAVTLREHCEFVRKKKTNSFWSGDSQTIFTHVTSGYTRLDCSVQLKVTTCPLIQLNWMLFHLAQNSNSHPRGHWWLYSLKCTLCVLMCLSCVCILVEVTYNLILTAQNDDMPLTSPQTLLRFNSISYLKHLTAKNKA